MKIINDILQHIAYSIANDEYVWTDQEKVAIKDNSHIAGGWSDLFISVNAFLNTNGGAIIIGIRDDEDNNKFEFSGFDSRNESKLRLLVTEFTNISGQPQDISEYIRFEIVPFLNAEVVVVYIDPLPDDSKYTYYKGNAYQRLVSGDARIPGTKASLPDEFPVALPAAEEEPVVAEEPEVVAEEEEQPLPAEPEEIEEVKPVFQEPFSGELITIFGSDYISLEPDLKQLLAYIYERNNHPGADKFPNADEIGEKIWLLKGGAGTPVELDMHKKKIKKTLFLMEKNDMLIRIKAQYRINTGYQVVKNLFN